MAGVAVGSCCRMVGTGQNQTAMAGTAISRAVIDIVAVSGGTVVRQMPGIGSRCFAGLPIMASAASGNIHYIVDYDDRTVIGAVVAGSTGQALVGMQLG